MADEELMGVVRRFELRCKIGNVLVLLGLIAALAAVIQLIPGDPADADPGLVFICWGVAAICVAAGLALRLFGGRMPPEAKTQRIAMMRAEQLQAKRQAAFLLMPLSLAFMLMSVVSAASKVANGTPLRHMDMFTAGCFVFFLLAFTWLLAGRGLDRWARPVLDDELSREFRGRALQFGYFILLPGVAALFVLSLVRRDLAIELTPILAALGVGGPALRLFFLERSANADAAE
jgi:hypothetical protein